MLQKKPETFDSGFFGLLKLFSLLLLEETITRINSNISAKT